MVSSARLSEPSHCEQWMKKPGAIKTHLPTQLVKYSTEAKYIAVVCNPRDVINGIFEDTFENLMSGYANSGNYFTFYKDWYERSRNPNVLFVVYEDLKRNPEDVILKIARFMGEKYEANLLKDDRKRLGDVVKYTSVDEMNFEFQGPEFEGFRQFHRGIHSGGEDAANSINYVRKRIVGDWKNHFSQKHLKRLNAKFRRKTEGNDIANLWPDMNFLH
ncbi:hypothetical protein HPB49_002021 [Dermacentor silvarum]|uniref:Uncharacterized protein n=1 Tax=Dermacentor silvarum TaxID=543639 RepID=A0ACB8DMA9_DERSI|nr:hypothetical protein HPB49_002021 [Dermacentor silvarum]